MARLEQANVWDKLREYLDAEIERLGWLDESICGFAVFNITQSLTLFGGTNLKEGVIGIRADIKGEERRNAKCWTLVISVDAPPSGEHVKVGGTTYERQDGSTQRLDMYLVPATHEDGTAVLLKEIALGIIAARGGMREGTELNRLMLEARDMLAERERIKKLPRQDVRRLHRQNDPTSKVTHVMTNPALFEAIVSLDVAGDWEKKHGRTVETAVSFSWEGEGVKIHRPISAYDREVHGAVSSLWADGQRFVSDSQIASAMGIDKPTKRQIASAVESVELQRRVMAAIDFAAEARGRTDLSFEGVPTTSFKLDGYLIAADRIQLVAANGRVVNGYQLLRAPIMYQHAAILGQITNYPQSVLELGDGRDNDMRLLLKRQLMRRVYGIKHDWEKGNAKKRASIQEQGLNRVRFMPDKKHPERTSLFEYAGVNMGDRDARKATTDYVLSILSGLAERGEISDYKLIRERGRGGAKTVGAEIILSTE